MRAPLLRVDGGKRPSLANGRLVDLHDPGTGLDERAHLAGDRLGDGPEEPVVGHARRSEAPVHDRDRPGQHALHRPAAGRLRDAPLADGHRLARHRRRGQDRRPRAAAAVAEHPAVAGGVEAVELLGEELDHVGPLELAVDQHVDPGLLLPGDRLGDQAVDLALVLGAIDLAAGQPDAQLAHLGRLRQRAGARGREERQVEVRLGGLALVAAGARADLADLRPVGRRRALLVDARRRPAIAAAQRASAAAFSRANAKPGGRSSPSTVYGRNMKLVDGTRRTGLPSSGSALDRASRTAAKSSLHTLRPSMTETTCSGCACPGAAGDSSSTASRGTWTARPRRPRAATVSADGRPNWTVTSGGSARPEVRGIGVGGVEQRAVVVGHGQAEARLVDLEAERRIALHAARGRRPTAPGRWRPPAPSDRCRRRACSA